MIIREHYINQVRPFYKSDLVKIITGIRRSGKSVILSQIMGEIREKHENVIFLNFEDNLTTSTIRNSMDLINYVKENRKPEKLEQVKYFLKVSLNPFLLLHAPGIAVFCGLFCQGSDVCAFEVDDPDF